MPEFDGSAIYRFLRENRPELEPHLVFATGDIANPESVEFLRSSGRPILEKPFTVLALRETLEQMEE